MSRERFIEDVDMVSVHCDTPLGRATQENAMNRVVKEYDRLAAEVAELKNHLSQMKHAIDVNKRRHPEGAIYDWLIQFEQFSLYGDSNVVATGDAGKLGDE